MKTKYVISLVVALFAVSALGVTSTRRNVGAAEASGTTSSPEAAASLQAPSPFPDVCIPGVPERGECCLWQIDRRVEGKREAKYSNAYGCDTGPTRRGEMRIVMNIKFAGTTCDQQDIPPDNCTLEAVGQVIRRDDDYAYFSGEFQITDPGGTVLFKGSMETTDRIGTHSATPRCEACSPQSHFEGWLVGRGTAAFPNHSLRAFIVSRGTVPPSPSGSTPLLGSLTGTLIKCP